MVTLGLITSLSFFMLIVSFKDCVKNMKNSTEKQTEILSTVIFTLFFKLGCLSLFVCGACLENIENWFISHAALKIKAYSEHP